MSTPSRQWAPAKGRGQKGQSFAELAANDERQQLAAEAEEADRSKRQLTPAQAPDTSGKRFRGDQGLAVTDAKMEVDKIELYAELESIRKQIDEMNDRVNTQQKQPLFALKSQADSDRLRTANEVLVINGTRYEAITRIEDEYQHRERFIEWCVKEAGTSKRFWPSEREYSHQVRADAISPQTHIKLAQPWLRKKLLDWQKEKYPSGVPEWWSTEATQNLGEKSEINTSNNGKILFKPQIPIWDRIKGVPLRTAMMILKEPLEIKDFAPVWSENSVKKHGNYVIWVTYNVTSGVAKVHIDSSVPFDVFVEAFENKFPSMATSAKGRGRGRGKGNRQGQQQAEHTQETRVQYPFTFQLIWSFNPMCLSVDATARMLCPQHPCSQVEPCIFGFSTWVFFSISCPEHTFCPLAHAFMSLVRTCTRKTCLLLPCPSYGCFDFAFQVGSFDH